MTPDMDLSGSPPLVINHPWLALVLYALVVGGMGLAVWWFRAPSPRRRERLVAKLDNVEERLEELPPNRILERIDLLDQRADLEEKIERLSPPPKLKRFVCHAGILERDLPKWKALGWAVDGGSSSPSVGKCFLVSWEGEGEPQYPQYPQVKA